MIFSTMTYVARATPLALSSVTDLITSGGGGDTSKIVTGILGGDPHLRSPRTLVDVTERQSVQSKASDGSRSPTVSTTDYEEQENVSDEEIYPSFDEQWLRIHLTRELESILREAKGKRNCWQVLLPRSLTCQVAQDMMGMSDCEPCGIRGCVLYVELEEEGIETYQLGRIVMSAETVPTFEMRLTLRRNSSGWLAAMGFEKLMRTVGRDSIVISDNYCLRKKRLYR